MDRDKELAEIAAIIAADRARPGRKRAPEKVALEILEIIDALYEPPVMNEAERTELAKACSHPTRIKILALLSNVPPELAQEVSAGLSPTALATAIGLPLGQMSYHVRGLDSKGMVELLHTEPRRGAIEHYYGITDLGRHALALVAPRRLTAAA